jgi:hypothetical protein
MAIRSLKELDPLLLESGALFGTDFDEFQASFWKVSY